MSCAVTAQSAVLIVGKERARRTGDKRGERVRSGSSFLQIKYGDTATSEGVLFATYSALIGESQAGGQHRTRLKQILEWCRENFDGVVSFFKKKKMERVRRIACL